MTLFLNTQQIPQNHSNSIDSPSTIAAAARNNSKESASNTSSPPKKWLIFDYAQKGNNADATNTPTPGGGEIKNSSRDHLPTAATATGRGTATPDTSGLSATARLNLLRSKISESALSKPAIIRPSNEFGYTKSD